MAGEMAALVEMLPGLGDEGLGLLLKAGLKAELKLEVDGEAVAAALDAAGAEDLETQKTVVNAARFLLAEVGSIPTGKLTEKRLAKGLKPAGFTDAQVRVVLAAQEWKHRKQAKQAAADEEEEAAPSPAALRLSESLFAVGDNPFTAGARASTLFTADDDDDSLSAPAAVGGEGGSSYMDSMMGAEPVRPASTNAAPLVLRVPAGGAELVGRSLPFSHQRPRRADTWTQ